MNDSRDLFEPLDFSTPRLTKAKRPPNRDRPPTTNEKENLRKYKSTLTSILKFSEIFMPEVVHGITFNRGPEEAWATYCVRQGDMQIRQDEYDLIVRVFTAFMLILPPDFNEKTQQRLFKSIVMDFSQREQDHDNYYDFSLITKSHGVMTISARTFEEVESIFQQSSTMHLIAQVAVATFYCIDQLELINTSRPRGANFCRFLPVYASKELNTLMYAKFFPYLTTMRKIEDRRGINGEPVKLADIMADMSNK